MRTTFNLLFFVSLLGMSLMSGCVDLKPKADNTRYYVLGQDNLAFEALSQKSTGGLRVGLRQITLPPHLDNPRMVTRDSQYEIKFSEDHRWGENLNDGISNAIALYISATDGIQTVEAAPWSYVNKNDFVIELEVYRFEAKQPNATQLVAAWTILNGEGTKVLKTGSADYETEGWTAGDFRQLAQMLDQSLTQLGGVIAEEILALN